MARVESKSILWGVLLLIVVLFLVSSCSLKCGGTKPSENYIGQHRYYGGGYYNACEFQPACLWDSARTIRLSNGMEGVCTLNGKACPSFSKDHARSRYWPLSPIMVDDIYNAQVNGPYDSDTNEEAYSGATALELGM